MVLVTRRPLLRLLELEVAAIDTGELRDLQPRVRLFVGCHLAEGGWGSVARLRLGPVELVPTRGALTWDQLAWESSALAAATPLLARYAPAPRSALLAAVEIAELVADVGATLGLILGRYALPGRRWSRATAATLRARLEPGLGDDDREALALVHAVHEYEARRGGAGILAGGPAW